MTITTFTVATFLTHQFAICGRSQRQVADELGYVNANVISMFKTGRTKVPYAVAGRLATAIGADPVYLLRLAMLEYDPELWYTLESMITTATVVTADERALLDLARKTGKGHPIDMESRHTRRVLAGAFTDAVGASMARSSAAVAAMNRLPRNAAHLR